VFGFTLAVSLLTGVLCGLAPSLQGSRTPVISALRATTGGFAASRAQMTIRKALIAVEVAMCVLLVTAAGLFARTLQSWKSVETGVDLPHLVQIPINPDPNSRLTKEQKESNYRELQRRIENLPGVRSVARSGVLFLANSTVVEKIGIEG